MNTFYKLTIILKWKAIEQSKQATCCFTIQCRSDTDKTRTTKTKGGKLIIRCFDVCYLSKNTYGEAPNRNMI